MSDIALWGFSFLTVCALVRAGNRAETYTNIYYFRIPRIGFWAVMVLVIRSYDKAPK